MGVEKGPLVLTINYDFAFSSNSVFRLDFFVFFARNRDVQWQKRKTSLYALCYAFCNNPVFIDNPTKNRKKNILEAGYY